MVLILSRSDLERVLSMHDVIQVLEEAFREQALGKTNSPRRESVTIPENDGWIGVMPAYIKGLNSFSTKIVSVYNKNLTIGLPTIMATIVLNDPRTGEVLSVMEGSYITAMRTGGLGGLAAKYLSRNDSETVGIFGAGIQARTQLIALMDVRKIKRVRVYDIIVDRSKTYAEEMRRKTEIPIEVSISPSEVVRNSDIIVTVSTSKEPVFAGKDVSLGAHVNAFGNFKLTERELDGEIVKRSKVIVDQREAAFAESGDLMIPIKEGGISKNHILAELGEVISGTKPGRTSPSDITLFKSVGLGIQDCATSALAYEKAMKEGIGTKVEL